MLNAMRNLECFTVSDFTIKLQNVWAITLYSIAHSFNQIERRDRPKSYVQKNTGSIFLLSPDLTQV